MTEPLVPHAALDDSHDVSHSATAVWPQRATAGRSESAEGSTPGLAVDPPPSGKAVLESVVLTLAVPAIGWIVDHNDPFLLKHPFPLMIFAPLLVGLRHGFFAGCTSSFVLGVALFVCWRVHALGVLAFPAEASLALFALAALTGQFSDVWRREGRRREMTIYKAKRRSEELARAHFLLELSHERLREENPAAANLRDALSVVGQVAASAGESWAPIADRMMSIFAAYGMLEVGVVVEVDASRRAGRPIAALGRAEPVEPDDALVVTAIRTRENVYLPGKSSLLDPRLQSRLLAAVPFVDVTGRLHAVLCVQSIPFTAYHKKNLETLAILAGHFADLLATRGECQQIGRERMLAFERTLGRALRDQREFGVSSVLVGLALRPQGPIMAVAQVVVGAFLRPVVAPIFARDGQANIILIGLMPAGTAAEARAIHARLEAVVRQELDASLGDAGATFSFCGVAPDDTPAKAAQRLFPSMPAS